MDNNFFEKWAEQDLSPFLTFSCGGKLIYSNNEAQFLLTKVTTKELYEIAMQYAPISYGFNTSYIDLNLASYKFYAVTVGYEDEETIGLKLYKSTMAKKSKLFKNNGEVVNIFTLIDLCISSNKIKSQANFIKSYDPSIPEFKIMVDDFLKLVNYIYSNFSNTDTVNTTIRLKIGEYIKLDGKKYSLIQVLISYDNDNVFLKNDTLEDYANSMGIMLSAYKRNIEINLPLILW